MVKTSCSPTIDYPRSNIDFQCCWKGLKNLLEHKQGKFEIANEYMV